jgi:RimJ/RimL family protein N-acetyltransferase
MTFRQEEFSSFLFTASWFRPQGQILAAEGDKIIGLAAVGYFAESNSMENLITGVLPAYRGRKIGHALKVVALRYASAAGADSIRTHNDSQNEPMLAINRKLGYKSQVGELRLVRRL